MSWPNRALRRCGPDASPDLPAGDGDSSLPIYRALASALGVCVRVDVIAGTSAGGLNGELLGTAIAAGQPYANVRDLWLNLGDLKDLLNDSHDPISLLKGEAVLYTQLRDRFVPLLEQAAAEDGDPETSGRRVRMILTGTDVAGVCRDTQDSFQGVLKITDHRLHARFAHGGDAGGLGVPAGWAELLTAAPEGRAGMAEAVARSARTSASFPIGFEPSELVLSGDSAAANTALGDALFTRGGHNVADVMRGEKRAAPLSRWAIDGGILDNSPIGVVLDTVTGLSAERPVQRAVVFVVPYTDDPAKPPEPRPDFAGVLNTTLNMPRDVAYTDHLEEVERDLARRAGDRTAYDQLLGLPPDVLEQLANNLYASFWRLRAVTSLWSLVQGYRSHLSDPPESSGVALPGRQLAGALAALAEKQDVQWLPPAKASPADLWSGISDPGVAWRWGGAPAERIALRIADWLMAARETLPVDAAAQRASLTAHQASVHAALRAYRVVERGRQLDESAAVDKAGTLTQEELVGIASKTWTKERQDAARALLGTVAAALVGAQGEPGLPQDVRDILGIAEGAAPGTQEEVARSLLMADVAWRGMRGELDDEHQSSNRYEFLRLNAAAPPPFGPRQNGEPGNKLFGMQLGHFAGFVRRSWRANDFMWGRLDGAARLVDLLLAPRRLRLSPVPYASLAAIPGLREPIPAKRKEYLDPDDQQELGEWRSCFQDTLALSIIDAELKFIVDAMAIDTNDRHFAEDPILADALGDGDNRQRFVSYAEVLAGGGAAPQRSIKQRVEQERGSDGGAELAVQAVDVTLAVLGAQGGPLKLAARLLDVPAAGAKAFVVARAQVHHIWRAIHEAIPGGDRQ